MNNKVSVIIPCFNNERTIERCILSALNQTHKNIEVICINDGSTDDSWSILKKIKRSHDNLFIFDNEQNLGPSFSRNKGVSLSTGKFISFLDADDHWHKKKLEMQLIFMKEQSLDFIGATCAIGVTDKRKINKEDLKLKIVSFNMLLFKNYFQTPSVVMKRDIFVAFNEKQRFSEDYMSWLLITCNKKNKCGLIYGRYLVFLDKFNFGISGLSSNLWLMEKWEIKNITYFLFRGKIMAILAIIVSFIKYIRRCILTIVTKKKVFSNENSNNR
ncbi:glycosyltransferase family 2 protein (plasmid) [Arsenophonus nasoniae]|nr:glycosyltransferase family 2 protein [Arsenophonus nasoniae]QBY45769.1 UDP-Glc:alpha-D-GlcNAc-diphosphoundecaprenol beta-1,3-glucosyltransferase WfgD [Arsenophonus nasoniae]WGM12836.1 glycosyltransferase family 2 protein [Arsenophonus nasoniae]WGM17544.1 glycosyltransferase family 2 protein [Arsenophonus nasoniae]